MVTERVVCVVPEGKDSEAVGAVMVAVGGVVSGVGLGEGGGGLGGGGDGGGGLGGGGVGVTTALTATVKLCDVAPPVPEQRMEYVVVTDGAVTSCPERAIEPLQPLEAVQEEALEVVQERVVFDPALILKGLAVKERVGAGTSESGIGITTALLDPPPPPLLRVVSVVVVLTATVPPAYLALNAVRVFGPTNPVPETPLAICHLDTALWVRLPKYPGATPLGITR